MKGLTHSRSAALTMCAVLAVLLLFGIVGPSLADYPVIPPCAKPYGRTYGAWSAAFWEWAFSLPVDYHPLMDTAPASAGQSGPVWFIGGSFVSASVERYIDVPEGVALFFPIFNAELSTVEAQYLGFPFKEKDIRITIGGWIDAAAVTEAYLDGALLPAFRAQSPLFQIGRLPENNIMQLPNFVGSPVPAGVRGKAVSDGYYIMLAPPKIGAHTLYIHAEIPDFGMILDITYHMNVVSE